MFERVTCYMLQAVLINLDTITDVDLCSCDSLYRPMAFRCMLLSATRVRDSVRFSTHYHVAEQVIRTAEI